MKFENDNAFGFMVGDRTKITVLDIDDKSERILAAALDRHGSTPILVRSGSGNLMRAIGSIASIALSGRGRTGRLTCWVLASSSHRRRPLRRAQYQFIQGSLDDLDRLPVLRDLDLPKAEGESRVRETINSGDTA